MMNDSTVFQTALPLRRDTYLVDEKDSELVGRLVRIYRTYAFSLSSQEQQNFRQMIRKREYKRRDGRPDPSNIVLHHVYSGMYHRKTRCWMGDKVTFTKWALLATLYSAESLAELAKVVTRLGIDRQPCWQKYADHHDGDEEKGDDNLGPLELPNAAELAAVCMKRVRIFAAPSRAAASGSDTDEALSVANDTEMPPPSWCSLTVGQQDVEDHEDGISGRIPSETSHGELERGLHHRKHSLAETDLASPQPGSKRRDCHSVVSHGINSSVCSPIRTTSSKPSNYESALGSDNAALIWQEIARLHQGLDSATADNMALRKIVDASEARINAQDVDKVLLQEALAREREQTCLLLQRVHKLEESHKSYSPIMDKIYQKVLEYTIRTDELAKNHQKRDEALLKSVADVEECQGSVEECQAGVEECQAGVEECHKVIEECRAGMDECRKVVEKYRAGTEECQMAVGNLPAELDGVKVSIRRMVETSMRKSNEKLTEELRGSVSFHRRNTTGSLREMNKEVQKALEETKRLAQQCSDKNLHSVVRQEISHLFERVGGMVKRGLEDKD
ncbi:hypothetical protein G3M48_002048 [Beauveria asiatica]|uniref:Uncharacterized protein n=1 Tax=Beauveria asiatica TaxID=1069075 RepID=A0AAW0RYP1_9HYPO